MDNEKTPKKSRWKMILLIIIPIILMASAATVYMVKSEKGIADIVKAFEKQGEYTMPLEEFLVNIKSNTGRNKYLKIKLALMYTDPKQGEILAANVSKIRDLIIADLRTKETEEILDIEVTDEIKSQMKKNINDNLKEDIVKAIYITDLIVQ